MKKYLSTIPAALLVVCSLFVAMASAQGRFFNFETFDSNSAVIEKQGSITGVSLAADFDGEGVNNDIALIDQERGVVFILNFIRKFPTPRGISTIDIRNMFDTPFIPTSATAFIDARTGLANIAITAVAAKESNSASGKIIIGLNDGTGLFKDPKQFSGFDSSAGVADINYGDFNNDGSDDLSFIDFKSNSATIALNDSSNRFLQQISIGTGGIEPVSAVIGDFNDDDNLDLVVLNKGNASGANSTVTTLLGDGKGRLLITGSAVEVSNYGVSMTGGLVDFIGRPVIFEGETIKRFADFNGDGYPDIAVLSTGGGTTDPTFPVVTALVSNPSNPGTFRVQPPVELVDYATKRPLVLALPNSQSSFGGAYHALGAGAFNGDDILDLVVSGSLIAPLGTPGAGMNFRAIFYLAGINATGSFRASEALFGYSKTVTGTSDLSKLDPADGQDSFVSSIPFSFAEEDGQLSGALHVSLNGSIFSDFNLTPTNCSRAPVVIIKRTDLNAPFPGGGRKEIITAGQSATIPVLAIEPLGRRLLQILGPTPTGKNPPPFVNIENNPDNTAVIKIDSGDVNRGPDDLIFPIVVYVNGVQDPPPGSACGRLPTPGRAFFTLVVKPNNPPAINPIPNQTIGTGETSTIELSISDKENQRVSTAVACDKGNFVKIVGNRLVIAPQISDVGASNCSITAKDEIGLSSSATFMVAVKPLPVIDNIEDQAIRMGEVRTVTVSANDPNSTASLKLSLISSLSFVSLTDEGNGRGTIRIAPTANDNQGGRVQLEVTTPDGRRAERSFSITLLPGIVVTGASFRSSKLVLNGSGFGILGAIVMINGEEISSRIISQTDSIITLKGSKKRLNLKRGSNEVTVTSNGLISNSFLFNLF